MMKLEKLEILDLYFYLSDEENVSKHIHSVLMKLEKEVFENYTVMEIEGYRAAFNNKGKI